MKRFHLQQSKTENALRSGEPDAETRSVAADLALELDGCTRRINAQVSRQEPPEFDVSHRLNPSARTPQRTASALIRRCPRGASLQQLRARAGDCCQLSVAVVRTRRLTCLPACTPSAETTPAKRRQPETGSIAPGGHSTDSPDLTGSLRIGGRRVRRARRVGGGKISRWPPPLRPAPQAPESQNPSPARIPAPGDAMGATAGTWKAGFLEIWAAGRPTLAPTIVPNAARRVTGAPEGHAVARSGPEHGGAQGARRGRERGARERVQ